MHIVGRIDRKIYECITDDITTDEVIITEERIQHIVERHPNDYEQYYAYLKTVVEDPDYIIEANKPNTALILKEIIESDERQFKTILRLKTSKDNKVFKNSIITFMKINEKEWSRLIRNKRILYKRRIKVLLFKYHKTRGCLRWRISYPSTRRWLDRGNPRDAGEWYACQTASCLMAI